MSMKQRKEAMDALIGQVGAPPGEPPKGFVDEYNYAKELMAKMGLDKKQLN